MIKKESLQVGNEVEKEKTDLSEINKGKKKRKAKKKFKLTGANSEKMISVRSWNLDSIDKKVQNKKFNSKQNQYEKLAFRKQSKDKKFGEGKKEKDEFVKSHKRKSGETHEGPDVKKVKLFLLKKKARKVVRQKIDNKSFDLGKKIKLIWEEVRRKDCKEEKKKNLIDELFKHVKGHVKELVFAHDTVRVLECIVNFGTNFYRSSLFDEIKDNIILLAKSQFGKRFLLKILQHGKKELKIHIVKSFHGKILELIKHAEAAEVVEAAFSGCLTTTEKTEMVKEFYGSSYKFLKGSESQSLEQYLNKNPDQKVAIINDIKEVLLRVLEKSSVKHSIIHYVLRQYMLHCDATSRGEIIESLREHVAEILHTKDGSRIAMQCIWYGTPKDRKVIVKHLKPFVVKAAKEEYGHMVLLALFDCVDDTKQIEKHIVMELNKNITELAQSLYGKKVLIYLLSPRDHYFFCPVVINILKEGDNNKSSKKDTVLRQSELKQMVEQQIIEMIKSQMSSNYTNNSFCLFVLAVLKHISGSSKADIFKLIAELASGNYCTEKVHIIENSGSSFLLKQLILVEKNTNKEESEEVLFSKTLISNVPNDALKTWIDCNRGCFLLVNLFESGIPSVIERIRSEMEGLKNTLQKKSFKGAEILLKKLKEN